MHDHLSHRFNVAPTPRRAFGNKMATNHSIHGRRSRSSSMPSSTVMLGKKTRKAGSKCHVLRVPTELRALVACYCICL